MTHARSRNANRPRGSVRRGFEVLLGALAICLLVTAPALAAQGPTKLEAPLVSPTTGTTATMITFEVTYRNHNNKAPEYVRVAVGSAVHAMSPLGALNYRDGVRYRWSGTLAVGSYEIEFRASDFEKFTDQLPGGTVTISAPPPPPDPTPTPKPAPTPTPPPAPDPTSPPAPAPDPGGGSTPEPGGSTTPPDEEYTEGGDGRGGANGATNDTSSPALGWVTPAMSWDGSGGSGGPAGGSDGSGGSGGSGGTGGTGGGDSGGSPTGGDPLFPPVAPGTGVGFFVELSSLLRGMGADPIAAVLPGGGGTTLPMVVSAVGSTAAVGVWMAFSLFGKRRRDEQPPAPEEVLQAAASSGLGLVPSSGLVPELPDPEMLMPRWRRPSLLEARKTDPIREGLPPRPSLSFGYDAASTNERRLIRYATVRLLDRPDEVMGLAVGDLAAGDEVELCERSGLFWFVRAPDGRAGWLHKMTLGDQVLPGARATA